MARLSELSRSIEGKVAIITGAASGMGRATARLFADEGAKVAAIDIQEEALQQVVTEIKEAGLTAEAWTLDLADPDAIKKVIADVADTFGGIDILVNNAGIIDDGLLLRMSDEAWARVINTNLNGTFTAVAPYFVRW